MNMIGFARLREALLRGLPNRSAAAISATTEGEREGKKKRINGRQQEDEESTQSLWK
jgi:hypothetical protein